MTEKEVAENIASNIVTIKWILLSMSIAIWVLVLNVKIKSGRTY
jgi:hypothetical protein